MANNNANRSVSSAKNYMKRLQIIFTKYGGNKKRYNGHFQPNSFLKER